MGGKGRIAKKIAESISNHIPHHSGTYWEPFIGGGAIAAKLGNQFDTANYSDIHPDLMLMWQALHDGWEPPSVVSYDEYQELRYAEQPSALRGFVGFGGSFGGRFFEGYARGGHNANGTPRNHQAESARALLRDAPKMRAKVETNYRQADAITINPQVGDVVYCDPPYEGTKNYSRTDRIDHAEFWEVAGGWAARGAHVFVSEYKAPDGWKCIWEQPLRSSVRVGSEDRHIATERLFTIGAR
ncbi:DNA adenine methylase [Glutamicibacter sp. AGC13]